MTLLTAEQLSFALGHLPLLDCASFTLEKGEKVGLIGRNGSGKSSFLKLLAGVLKPDDGLITLQKDLNVVYVPQEPVFDNEQTIFDYVADGLGEVNFWLKRFHQLSLDLLKAPQDETLLKNLHQAQSEIEIREGWITDRLIHRVLDELDLDEDAPIKTLSGGQKKRAALAQALVQEPDVLLLDEPTNHLDIDGIAFLENLLSHFAGSMVVITHDRAFLDQIASRIVELDRGVLRSYPGNFTRYQELKAQQLAEEALHNRRFDQFHAQEEVWIRQGIEARRTRNQGRVKRLQALRQQRARRRERPGQVSFALNRGEEGGKIVAQMEHLSFAYPEGRTMIRDFSTTIMRQDKVGLIGPNGVGKTTFLRLILGELEPTAGKLRHGTRQSVAYFDQLRSQLNDNKTLFDTIGQGRDSIEINGKQKHVMSYLADFLFPPERAMSPVASLSGGERNRLLLASLFTRPANILILDEPTNDLDIDTQELLEELLSSYTGTVFLVSHDRRFLDNVVTQSIVFFDNGNLKEYIGGYSDYQDTKRREEAMQPKNATLVTTASPQSSPEKPRRHSVKLSYNEQRELDQLPQKIHVLEEELATLQQHLLQPDVYKDRYQEAIAWQQRISEIEEALLELLERWEILENKQNGSHSTE